MAEDWLADVRKYAADADEAVVDAIVRYCGIALRNRDSSLVSFSDPKETGRVRENFLRKKLALTDDDATLDTAIAATGERMAGDPTKNRVTVYYLLADRFGLLHLFGGGTPAASAVTSGAAGLAALGAAAPAAAEPTTAIAPPASAARPAASAPRPLAAVSGASRVSRSPTAIGLDDVNWGWVTVLLGGILFAGFLAMGLRQVWHQPAPMVAAAAAPPVAPVAATAPAIPQGAGVVASDRDARPMLTIYFDTAKAEVSDQIATAATAVKAYVETHPGASLAVSGFNDPTGNAAANAELSKNRAQNTKAALERLGVPADKVKLEKPAETTGTATTNSGSRRVEVVVKE